MNQIGIFEIASYCCLIVECIPDGLYLRKNQATFGGP